MKKFVNLFLLGFLCPLFGKTNVSGEKYIMACPHDHEHLLEATTGKDNGWFTVEPGERQNVSSFQDSIYLLYESSFGISNASFQVEGNNVSIFGHCIPSMYTPLPVQALGRKYIVVLCHSSESLLVVASHVYQTNVEITFKLQGTVSYENKTYSDGDTLSLRLEPYQAFTFRSDVDLSGTVVSSSNTVAVFSGQNVPSLNIQGYDQLLPVDRYGQEYVVAVSDLNDYTLLIVSESGDSQLTFNNGTQVTLNENRVLKQTMARDSSIHFTSSSPVFAAMCGDTEGFLVVPPVSNYIYQSSFLYYGQENHLQILTENASDVELNISTASISIQWKDIQGSDFKVGTVKSSFDTVAVLSITSTARFAVIHLTSVYMHNGGYAFDEDNKQTQVNCTFSPHRGNPFIPELACSH